MSHTMSLTSVVISLSKIKISKAIHNPTCFHPLPPFVVISLSKIEISSVIHNFAIQ